MAVESFLFFNYFSKELSSLKPRLDLLPLTFLEKKTSQSIELTPYAHSLLNFGNYVYVNPIQFSLEGVKFSPKYLSQKPEIFLSMLAEAQKLSPLFYMDSDYYGGVFMNSWSSTKGNSDLLGTYSLDFTYYNLDVLNAFGKNDVQLGDIDIISNDTIPALDPKTT